LTGVCCGDGTGGGSAPVVTVALASNPTGAALSGATAVRASDGAIHNYGGNALTEHRLQAIANQRAGRRLQKQHPRNIVHRIHGLAFFPEVHAGSRLRGVFVDLQQDIAVAVG
jgi:hypothetical protein